MIYRIICSGHKNPLIWRDYQGKIDRPASKPRIGLLGAWCAQVRTDWPGLACPCIENKRVRFFFTEKGWDLLGRNVAADARRDGRMVRVLRRKNPHPSGVVYEDDLQVAILPRTRVPRKNRK